MKLLFAIIFLTLLIQVYMTIDLLGIALGAVLFKHRDKIKKKFKKLKKK